MVEVGRTNSQQKGGRTKHALLDRKVPSERRRKTGRQNSYTVKNGRKKGNRKVQQEMNAQGVHHSFEKRGREVKVEAFCNEETNQEKVENGQMQRLNSAQIKKKRVHQREA